MLARDVEMFIEYCENKGLATKTIGSYEQTLRLLMLWLDKQGIVQTEKITHVVIQDYVKQIKERGKYTVTSNPNSGNYQERRIDFGKKVSDVTMSARISNNLGLEYDRHNFLLMHAMGPNVAGVIGSAVAAGALLGFLS